MAVEGAFKRNIISSICCTSTLAAGDNLPASRVIVRSPKTGKEFVTGAQYIQIIGRAGRTGLKGDSRDQADLTDSTADSFILVHPNDVSSFKNLVERPVEPVTSQLSHVSSHYRRCRFFVRRHGVDEFTGITRILVNTLSNSIVPLTLSQLAAVYKLTLLYQSGEAADGTEAVEYTLVPFLKELMVRLNYIFTSFAAVLVLQ